MKRILTLMLLFLSITVLSACGDSGVRFELIGDIEVNYHTNNAYSEEGFIARDETLDISGFVTMEGNINPTVSGDYLVTYTLEYKDKTTEIQRIVHYRESGCSVILETNITECQVFWSEYLHTYINLRVYYENDDYHDQVNNVFQNVENIISKYHKLSDKYDTYPYVTNVKTINDDPTTTHVIDHELFDLISFTLDHQEEVDYRFNLALGPVLEIWHNYREACNTDLTGLNCPTPLLSDLQAADQFTDPEDISLDEENLTITMLENMSIDLGGVSKGYISDKIVEYLDALNFLGYLFNNGESNISIGGSHPTRDNSKYLLAITDPTFSTAYYATVYLGDGDQLVTSGDYQQFFISQDVVYHHIISPNTLMPEHHSRSVSIITSDAGLADLYSTAIFTMTIPEGLAFVNNIEGLEAIWYGLDDVIYFSENFEDLYLVEQFN